MSWLKKEATFIYQYRFIEERIFGVGLLKKLIEKAGLTNEQYVAYFSNIWGARRFVIGELYGRKSLFLRGFIFSQ